MNRVPSYEDAKKCVLSLLNAKEGDVVRRFLSLPNAKALKCPNASGPAIFVPGTRKNKILLVAHYDTVWKNADLTVRVWGPIVYSGHIHNKQHASGIGADDRAGCATLWMCRDLGHSLLILPDEEIGCKGSRDVANLHKDVLAGHCYAIQFDRRGSKEVVYYENHNQEFMKFMENDFFFDYKRGYGSSTDVKVLGPALGIASCNVAIGYQNEHTQREILNLTDFYHTLLITYNCLQNEDLHKNFAHVQSSYLGSNYYSGRHSPHNSGVGAESAPLVGNKPYTTKQGKPACGTGSNSTTGNPTKVVTVPSSTKQRATRKSLAEPNLVTIDKLIKAEKAGELLHCFHCKSSYRPDDATLYFHCGIAMCPICHDDLETIEMGMSGGKLTLNK